MVGVAAAMLEVAEEVQWEAEVVAVESKGTAMIPGIITWLFRARQR